MAKTTKRKSFIFNIEWQEVLLEYPAEVRLEVYDAIIEYVASGTLSELKPMARIAFSFIKKEIDYNEQRYQDVVNKRSEAGKRSAESRNNNKSTNSTNVNKCQQASTNATDNVNDNDNDNDLKKGNKSNDLFPKENETLFPDSQTQASKPTKKFSPPTLQDVQAYCKERNNTVDAEHFLAYYQANGWKVGKNPMKDWRAAVRTWERNRSTTSANGQSGVANVPTGVKLGVGERIVDGRRTYGQGKANIPMNAPPRPADGYSWDMDNGRWIYQ